MTKVLIAWAVLTATVLGSPSTTPLFDDTCSISGYGTVNDLKGVKLENGRLYLFFRMENQEKSTDVISFLNYLENRVGVNLRIGLFFESVTPIPNKLEYENIFVVQQYPSFGVIGGGNYYAIELEYEE